MNGAVEPGAARAASMIHTAVLAGKRCALSIPSFSHVIARHLALSPGVEGKNLRSNLPRLLTHPLPAPAENASSARPLLVARAHHDATPYAGVWSMRCCRTPSSARTTSTRARSRQHLSTRPWLSLWRFPRTLSWRGMFGGTRTSVPVAWHAYFRASRVGFGGRDATPWQ